MSVQSLQGRVVEGPVYPEPPIQSTIGKIVGRGKTYWINGGGLTRFTYNP